MSEELRANQEAAGIPDSKPFISGEGEQTPIESCHINGVVVSALNLDPQVIAALDYWSTDEGIAEKNARPNVRPPSGITSGPDGWDKGLKERRDDVKQRDVPLYEARDPLREVAQQYAKPGMRPRYMSAKKLKDGVNPDYEIVKKENGDPVMVRGMVLGHIPEDVAIARNKHYQKRGNEMLKELNEKYKKEGGPTARTDQ